MGRLTDRDPQKVRLQLQHQVVDGHAPIHSQLCERELRVLVHGIQDLRVGREEGGGGGEVNRRRSC